MKIFLISEIDKVNGFYQDIIPFLQKYIKDNMIITFIPSDFENTDKNDYMINNIANFFTNIKIKLRSNIIDYRIKKEHAKSLIDSSDILFILGGNPQKEMKFINKYDLVKTVNKFNGIMIGVSAGAINMAKTIYYENNNSLITYSGLGLTNINIYPHFDTENKEMIEEIKRIKKHTNIIALPKESFIFIDNKINYINNYYEYKKE